MLKASYVRSKSAGSPRKWPKPQLNHDFLFKNNICTDTIRLRPRVLELEYAFDNNGHPLDTESLLPKLHFPQGPSLEHEVTSGLSKKIARRSSSSRVQDLTPWTHETKTGESSSSGVKESSFPSSRTTATEASHSELTSIQKPMSRDGT